MATLKKTFISTPENLRMIRPIIWRAIQTYCSEDFATLDISVPDTDEGFDDTFYGSLCEKLKSFEVKEQTARLAEVLVGLDEFSSAQSEDFSLTLHAIAEDNKVEERFLARHDMQDEQLSTIELGVLLMIDSTSAARFQSYRSCLSVDKSTFAYYNCRVDGQSVEFKTPSPADLLQLATKFKEQPSYKKVLKIKDYCVINMFERQAIIIDDAGEEQEVTELLFNISRSNRPVVSPKVDNEAVGTITYVPPTTDVVIANPATKQLRTNTQSESRKKIYLQEIATLLSPDVVPCIEKAITHTFAPLEREGWQSLFNPANIEGLHHVRLKEVWQLAQDGQGQFIDVVVRAQPRRSLATYSQQDEYAAGDISNLKKFHDVQRMTLEFIFEGEARYPVIVKIPDPYRLCIKRKQHAPAVSLWLQQQGFVAQETLPLADE